MAPRGSNDHPPPTRHPPLARFTFALHTGRWPCRRRPSLAFAGASGLRRPGGYKPEAPAKAIGEGLRRPDNPSVNRANSHQLPQLNSIFIIPGAARRHKRRTPITRSSINRWPHSLVMPRFLAPDVSGPAGPREDFEKTVTTELDRHTWALRRIAQSTRVDHEDQRFGSISALLHHLTLLSCAPS